MSDQRQRSSELVSALVDGALNGDDLARALEELATDSTLDGTWDTYHLVGQAMRSSTEPVQMHDPAFVMRLRQQLVLKTPELIASSPLLTRAESQKVLKGAVSNDSWWRRVAGFASVALVGVLAWQGAVWMAPGRPTDTTLAQSSEAPVPMAGPQSLVNTDGASPLMIRDPQLDALLAAHRQLGGATALQMPSGFLRNATFSEDKR